MLLRKVKGRTFTIKNSQQTLNSDQCIESNIGTNYTSMFNIFSSAKLLWVSDERRRRTLVDMAEKHFVKFWRRRQSGSGQLLSGERGRQGLGLQLFKHGGRHENPPARLLQSRARVRSVTRPHPSLSGHCRCGSHGESCQGGVVKLKKKFAF